MQEARIIWLPCLGNSGNRGVYFQGGTGIRTGAEGHKRVLSWLYFEDVSKFEVRGLPAVRLFCAQERGAEIKTV